MRSFMNAVRVQAIVFQASVNYIEGNFSNPLTKGWFTNDTDTALSHWLVHNDLFA